MSKFLIEKGYKVEQTDYYILAEGELPVCLVAHLDTVGPTPPHDIYYDKTQHVMWSPQLLGADDRAGIYAIIQILEDGYRPSILFTTDEELCCVGAEALVTQKPKCPLENLKAIIEIDRCGKNDCVFYDCINYDFIHYIQSFDFKFANGSFSDISIIGPAWGVAAVNLSCGYYNEHSYQEILKTDELELTIEKIEDILSYCADMPFFEYIEDPNSWKKYLN